jgi:hypothetical protein
MATIQGRINITQYLARLEQAITDPERKPAYVLSLHGSAEQGDIDHALLYFYPAGSPKEGTGDVTEGYRVRAFFTYQDYGYCIDMLRNEKPMYFHYSYQSTPDSPPILDYYALSTSDEPAGEEE